MYRVQPVSGLPSRFELETRYSGFYTKYINIMGIPVLSSDEVCDCVLQKAAWIVHGTLSHLKHMELVLEQMRSWSARVSIMAEAEVTTDVPEHSDLTPPETWDAYRGLGATQWRPASSGAEENVMCSRNDIYSGENILLHEFTHGIARTGFMFLDWNGQDWDTYNGEVYESARAQGLWDNTYAGSNNIEYFAEGVQVWFNAQLEPQCCSGSQDPTCNDGIHNCIDTRKKLKQYDPGLYQHLSGIWKADGWSPGDSNACGCVDNIEKAFEGFVELDSDGNKPR
jgi:alpha-glucosidase